MDKHSKSSAAPNLVDPPPTPLQSILGLPQVCSGQTGANTTDQPLRPGCPTKLSPLEKFCRLVNMLATAVQAAVPALRAAATVSLPAMATVTLPRAAMSTSPPPEQPSSHPYLTGSATYMPGFSFPAPRRLDQIVKYALLERESPTEMKRIWADFHSTRTDSVASYMTKSQWDEMKNLTRAK